MEITRRKFNLLVASAAILYAAGTKWLSACPGPMRFMKVLNPKAFPGRLRPLNEAEIRKAGKWSG